MAQPQVELPIDARHYISAVRFSPHSDNTLLVTSWDGNVYVFQSHSPADPATAPSLLRKITIPGRAIMSATWGPNEQIIYTGDNGGHVRMVQIEDDSCCWVTAHESPVAFVEYSQEHSVVCAASFDGTMSVLPINREDFGCADHASTVKLPSKPCSMAASANHLLVGMTARAHEIYNLRDLAAIANRQEHGGLTDIGPEQQRESSLKFATRSMIWRPDGTGFVVGSIEGRVAVEWLENTEEAQAKRYAFKCHRIPNPNPDEGETAFPVHALAWHTHYNTFATGGGDGVVALWDAEAKRRIRQYQKYSNGISALSFSRDGTRLAIAICPTAEDKGDFGRRFAEGGIKVVIRHLGDDEAKSKSAKSKT